MNELENMVLLFNDYLIFLDEKETYEKYFSINLIATKILNSRNEQPRKLVDKNNFTQTYIAMSNFFVIETLQHEYFELNELLQSRRFNRYAKY